MRDRVAGVRRRQRGDKGWAMEDGSLVNRGTKDGMGRTGTGM